MLIRKDLGKVFEEVEIRQSINWDDLYGEKFLDKWQSFLIRLSEITLVLTEERRIKSGYFWIICDDIIGSLFEDKVETGEKIYPMGLDAFYFLGFFKKRWRVYVEGGFKVGQVLIGYSEENGDPNEIDSYKCCAINICNLVA